MFREAFEHLGNPSAVSIPHAHTHIVECGVCCDSYGVPQVCMSLHLAVTYTNIVQINTAGVGFSIVALDKVTK